MRHSKIASREFFECSIEGSGLLKAALGVVACIGFSCLAASPPDKSGVKPNSISLPSGAGSIEGLGESFEPQLNTGGSSYGITISVPPARAGLAPSIRLAYNSFSGNGIAGIGWSLEFMAIKRQCDKGFPEYDSGDTFVFGGEELVPLNNAAHDWRCENERSFQRLRQLDSDGDGLPDAWEMTERNGTKHTFGRFRGQDGRWSTVEHPGKAGSQPFDRTYCWMLDTTTDLHGNRIEYEYMPRNGVLYPNRITYSHLANNFHEVLFQYQARPDAFDDYRPSFSARMDSRLWRIEVRSQGQLVRAYNFAYTYEPGDLLPAEVAMQNTYLDLGVTLLKRVTQVDRSGSDLNYLPSLVFTYSGLDLANAEQRTFTSAPELDLANPEGRVQLVDLDGDSLPDLFATTLEGATKVQRAALNRGETSVSGQQKLTFAAAKAVIGSTPIDLAEPNIVVHDPKGKGLVDLSALQDDGANKRLETFLNRARLESVDENTLGFSHENIESTVLANPPAFVTYSAAATRQMDVNFDKKGDFVNLETGFGGMTVNTFYLDRTGNWVSGQSTLPSSYPLANTFQDSTGNQNVLVHLADMNGDRLLDLVCLIPTSSGGGQRIRVSYWPLVGRGRYGDEITLTNTGLDTFDIGTVDLRDLFVEDITGDGLGDILYLDGSGPETVLSLRVNVAGQRWSPPYTRGGLPRYAPRDPSNPTVLRMADLNGNGSTDILFRNTTPDQWSYFELLPKGAPSLIVGIDNGLGLRTAIVYGSAAEDEQQARESGNPWKTFAPIALQVVRQIRVSCGVDLNGDGKEDTKVMGFRYRDPYYDGFEREFRGFAFAQRIDYGDDFVFDPPTGLMQVSSGWNTTKTPTGQKSGPSLVSRYRFYTGAADQRDNDDYGGPPPPDRKIDEITDAAGREEEPLKGLQLVEEQVDPVVLHSATDGGFDAGCAAALLATTPEGQATLTPNAYVYTRTRQEWTMRRLYRPAEPLPYIADQDANGLYEDYRDAPVPPVPQGRFTDDGITVLPGNGRSVSYVFAANRITEVHDANGLLTQALGYPAAAPQRSSVFLDYDDYGNQVYMRETGLEAAGFDDERLTTTTYAHGGNALALWVIDKPDVISVTDENGVFVSKNVHFYDGDPFVGIQGQIQNRALLHRTLEYAFTNKFVESSRSKYDVYGNADETRDPIGNTRRMVFDPVFRTHSVKETMVVGGGLPDLVVEVDYDLGFGVVTLSKDFNGNLTTYHYDSFARIVKIVRPGDTVALPTTAYEYEPADPVRGRSFVYNSAGALTVTPVPVGSVSRVITKQREVAGEPGQFITAEYSDGSVRKLMGVEEGETPGTWMVTQATSYNLRGQAQSQWLPYQVSSAQVPHFPTLWPSGRPPASDGVNPSIVATDFYYDAQAREIRNVSPPETWGGPRLQSITQYLPVQKRIFDEEDARSGSPHADTPMVEFFDGLGRLIAVEEVVRLTDTGTTGPLTTWRTEYSYDLNDQLTRIKDSQNNLRTMINDGLKRLVYVNDPDRGQTTFVFDDASNLRETIDAKGQKTVFTYDGVNRIKTEDYQDGGSNVFDVEYFYDIPVPGVDLGNGTTGTASNTKGQIAYVRDLSGETHFSYDTRARPVWELKRIPDHRHGQLISYRTQFAYDSADRKTVLTFPDGDEVRHTYNDRSLLSRVYGASLGDVISSISYRSSKQMRQITYGNQVNTSYSHDPRLRVTDLETINPQSTRILDFHYTFDGVSNLEKIEDQRTLIGMPSAASRFNTQVFTYDNLYRLTRVEYPGLAVSSTNFVANRYDRIGNMLAQTSSLTHVENGRNVANVGNMESGGVLGRHNRNGRNPTDPPGPHAVTSIDGRAYEYDANGNIKTLDGMACEWDFKNRLIAVENDQVRASYSYDYVDRRITKTVHWKNVASSPGEESPINPSWRVTAVHYINRNFEVREGDSWVKYIWLNDTRVARVTGHLGAPSRIQHVRLNTGWNQVCLNVAGQFPVLDPANNSDLTSTAYFSDAAPGNGFVPVTASTSLSGGMVLWINAVRETTLMLVGTPALHTLPQLTGNSQFIGNVLPEPLDAATLLQGTAWLARYDATSRRWHYQFPETHEREALNESSATIAPGQALWISGGSARSISNSFAAMQIRYYHRDHLGSTAAVTDHTGQLVEENVNYPYGHPRFSYRPGSGQREAYAFTQKERDKETGLHYFEARYLAGVYGRFMSVDPPINIDIEGLGRVPQNLNVYSYGLNNPLRYTDPSGCGAWSWFRENVWIPGVDDVDEFDAGRTAKVAAGVALMVAPLPTKHIGAQLLVGAIAADQVTSGVLGTDSYVYQAGEKVCDGCGPVAEIGATLGASTAPMIGAKLAQRVPEAAMKLPYAGSGAFANTVEVSPRAFAATRPPVRATMPGGFQGPACTGLDKEIWISAQLEAAGPARLEAQMQGLNAFDEVVAPIFDKADELFGRDILP